MVKQDKTKNEALQERVSQVLLRQLAVPLSPGLYLVATPIGNLADISLRALAILACADIVYCEDKRHSARLLNHYGIVAPLRSYHEHSAGRVRDALLSLIREGQSVVLVSDAGTPLVSDPGYKLVREAKKQDLPVIAIPGASAPLTALVSAGLPTDSFTFAGFLPSGKAARQKRLLAFAGYNSTLVFFESPKRLKASLEDFARCYPGRNGAVAREMTKLHETVLSGPLNELADHFARQENIRGEIVILVGPPDLSSEGPDEEELAGALRTELEKGSLRDAVQAVCAKFNLPRSGVYNLAVRIRNENEKTKGA